VESQQIGMLATQIGLAFWEGRSEPQSGLVVG